MKCIDLKIRTKKGTKYLYCATLRKEVIWDDCKVCRLKKYPELKKYIKKEVTSLRKPRKTPKKDISAKTRTFVNARDQHICQLCGKWDSHHLHHIIYRSEDSTLINSPTNLITLCVECHAKVHSNKRYWQPLLLEKMKTRK